jgi:hypothetical protein
MGGEGIGSKRRPVFPRIIRGSVVKGDCLVFQGGLVKDGYAQIRDGRLRPHVHRAMWEECFGLIPDGYEVHHTCPNNRCVNPEHLRCLPEEEHWQVHGKKRREHGTETMYTHGRCRCDLCREAASISGKKRYLRRRGDLM